MAQNGALPPVSLSSGPRLLGSSARPRTIAIRISWSSRRPFWPWLPCPWSSTTAAWLTVWPVTATLANWKGDEWWSMITVMVVMMMMMRRRRRLRGGGGWGGGGGGKLVSTQDVWWLVLCFSEIWIHTGCAWKTGSKVYEKGQPQADLSAECCGYPR